MASQLERLKIRLSSDFDISDTLNDAILNECLEQAKNSIMMKRFPFGWEATQELEPQYLGLQVDLAIINFNKLGIEGESSHSEGVITRTYESEDTLLRQVVSKCKCL